MHQLVIRFSALGDIALTIPVFKTLEQKFPNQKFYFLTRPAFVDLFLNCKNVTVIPVDIDDKYDGLNGLNQLAKNLQQYTFDKVIDLHDVLRTKVLRNILKVKYNKKIVVFKKGRKEKKQRLKSKETEPYLKHTSQRYLDAFQISGKETNELIAGPWMDLPSDIQLPLNLNQTSKRKKWIGIAPFSKHDSKEWSKSKLDELAKKLLENQDVDIFLFAFGETEKSKAKSILENNTNIQLIDESIPFLQQMKLIQQLDVMLSMDSANMHLASILGTKVISIWISTHPSIGFGPLGNEEFIIQPTKQQAPWQPLSVYGKTKKKDLDLIQQTKDLISVDDIYSTIQKAFNS